MKPAAVTYVVFREVSVIECVVCSSYEIFEGMNHIFKKWKLFYVKCTASSSAAAAVETSTTAIILIFVS
jgi:hypothetical protein